MHTVHRSPLVIEHDIVESDSVALRIDVDFANPMGLITRITKCLGERRQVFRHLAHRIEDPVSVRSRGGARHDGSPGRYTDRILGVMARKVRTVTADPFTLAVYPTLVGIVAGLQNGSPASTKAPGLFATSRRETQSWTCPRQIVA